MFSAIAAYFLLTEHSAHSFGALPFLLLAACPVMYMSMHGGHGGHREHWSHGSRGRQGGYGNHADGKQVGKAPERRPVPKTGEKA